MVVAVFIKVSTTKTWRSRREWRYDRALGSRSSRIRRRSYKVESRIDRTIIVSERQASGNRHSAIAIGERQVRECRRSSNSNWRYIRDLSIAIANRLTARLKKRKGIRREEQERYGYRG